MNEKWTITVETPFGKEVYQMDIFQDAEGIHGRASNEKGFLDFKNAELNNGILSWSAQTEVPVKANVFFTGTIDNNTMCGKIKIDDYTQVEFKGEK